MFLFIKIKKIHLYMLTSKGIFLNLRQAFLLDDVINFSARFKKE